MLKSVRLPEVSASTVRGQYAAGWRGGERSSAHLQRRASTPSRADTFRH
ncbi:hypothetical protein LT493_22065 [Streptomyces tricolor]|nr:hypothetical protein [Streptomyces tricolor]